MNIKELKLEEFLGDCQESGSTGSTAAMLIDAYSLRGQSQTTLCELSDWKIVGFNANHTDVGLTYKGTLVGIYYESNLFIDYPPEYSGKRGLSVPMILLASQNRQVPSERKLTSDGKRALERAWRVARGCESSTWWPCTP